MKTLQQNTKVGWFIAAIMAILVLTACGSGEWGEIEDIVTEQADITVTYITGLEKAESAEDMADVINEFTDSMKALIPKIKTYQETHPEIWTGGEEVPEKIKVQQERMEEASARIQGAFMNLMNYMMDSKVQEAMMNMSSEMAKLE